MCLYKGCCTSIPLLGLCISFLQAIFEALIVKEICLDAPVVQFIGCLHQCEEICIWPSEDALKPSWKRLHWLGDSARLSIDLDEMGAATWAVICSEHREHTLVEHFDPLCGAMEPVANYDSEIWVFGVFNIPFGASLEVVFMSFNLGFKLGNLLFEMPLLLNMALLPNSDGTDQGGCNSMEGDCIDVGFYGEGSGDRVGGAKAFKGGFLYLWFWEGKRVGGYGVR
jgi:hypothetical protein